MTLRFINTLILLSTFLLGSEFEIGVFENAGLSVEIILIFISFVVNLFFYRRYNNLKFKNQFVVILLLLTIILFFVLRDLLISNFRTFYFLIFYLLIFSLVSIRAQEPFYFNVLLTVLLLIFVSKALIYPEVLEDLDYLDSEGSRIYRIRTLGFESNAVGVIFCTIFVYALASLNYSSSVLEKVLLVSLLILSVVLVVKTYSRAAYLSLILTTIWMFYRKFAFYLFSIPILLYFFHFLVSEEIISSIVVERFLNSVDTNNPRLDHWRMAYDDFYLHLPLSFFFGIGFFNQAIDNTYLNIFYSVGLIGFILFFSLLVKLFRSLKLSLYSKVIVFVLLFNFLFIDFFAQRKILLIAFFLIVSLERKYLISKS